MFESWLFTRSAGLAGLFRPEHWLPSRYERSRSALGSDFGLSQMVTREQLVEEVRGLAVRLLSRKLESHHRFLVEKTPSPYTDVDVAAEVFPGARFIHVLRDGRDVAVSVRAAARSWNPGLAYGGATPIRRLAALRRAGRSWASTVEALRDFGNGRPDRYMEVRYETLQARPLQVSQALFEFCRIPCEKPLLREIRDRTDFEVRFEPGEDRFRRGGRVGDWRHRFGALDAAVFEGGSRGTLVEAGYERSRLWWIIRTERLRGNWPEAGGSQRSLATGSGDQPPR